LARKHFTAPHFLLYYPEKRIIASTKGIIVSQLIDQQKAHACMTLNKSIDLHKRYTSVEETNLVKLYEQFSGPVHTYIYRLLGNQEDADDITQEVFIRACTAWDTLHEREHLSAWLYRIATNLCIDLMRRRKRFSWWPLARRQWHDSMDEEEFRPDTLRALSDSGGIPEIAERELIHIALRNMPTEYAIALVLSAAQGIPYQEVARIVGVTPNTAATRISRAKKMFALHYQRLLKDGAGVPEKNS
jgi:RNA polymerase sigma-70 factor, ECF subfamily